MSRFKFRPNHHCRGIPQLIGEELSAIAERDGKLTPRSVVEEAEPVDSPLHSHFTWDDSVAAEQHRLWEARLLIRAVVIISDDDTDNSPAFVNVRVEDGQAYMPMAEVIARPDFLASAISLLASKLESANDALATLERAAGTMRMPKVKRIAEKIAEARTLAADLIAE